MNKTSETRQVCSQFSEMLNWAARGWRPAPKGRVCPECGGAVWLKQTNRFTETHHCVVCLWGQDYRVG